jgi:predicted GNAT superfamily acetyltransferase
LFNEAIIMTERANTLGETERSLLSPNKNPDTQTVFESPFILRSDSVPQHLRPLFTKYDFRRLKLEEVLASDNITHNAWPGMVESTGLDLTARELVNAPVGGAFTKEGELVAYSRLLWGYDNLGEPEMHSHMTAVSSQARDGGIGESLKWFGRQMALEFPSNPVTQLSVTFDNIQGRASHVNLNKLGIVVGYAGGVFRRDIYQDLQGEQHRGNPTDRYQARWYMDSEWVLSHLEDRAVPLTTELIQGVPQAVQVGYDEIREGNNLQHLPIPESTNMEIDHAYISLPIPMNWEGLLYADRDYNFRYSNAWRDTTRNVIENYHANGYTTIGQVTDKSAGLNLQLLAYNFNPYNPPQELVQ